MNSAKFVEGLKRKQRYENVKCIGLDLANREVQKEGQERGSHLLAQDPDNVVCE